MSKDIVTEFIFGVTWTGGVVYKVQYRNLVQSKLLAAMLCRLVFAGHVLAAASLKIAIVATARREM